MSKVFVDANLLIYLNTVTNAELRSLLESFYLDLLTRYKAFTDPLVLDELIYVSKVKYGVPYDVSLEFIDAVVKPYVVLLPIGEDEFNEAAKAVRDYGMKPSDALHYGAMRTRGIPLIASEDSDFDGLPEVKRIWAVPNR
ncbi:MAG: type II toxin-antitoxin system VapC family toxin [Desulfurococcales archaeon]|nr:type II toxin-antitoxin system VapC family toxin [Desulfurococcales archaeon]